MNKTLIIIPTYNEKENIEKLIKKISELNLGIDILIVDDNSPDGTARLIRDISKKTPHTSIIERKNKMGIGSAYIEGFKYALNKGYDYIFEMDGDLSHDPKYIPNFLEVIKEYDLVLGSRYVKGGGTVNWGILRKTISILGNIYARTILVIPVKDITGGFKCFRKEILESLDLDDIKSRGYAFQIEVTYKAYKKNFRIKEIPIIFYERPKGKSKMTNAIVLEAFFRVWWMKIKG